MADTTSQKLEANLKKILEENHPLYDAYCGLWKLYYDAYKGGEYIKNYVYQHVRESDDSVKKRRNKAVYPNYVRPIINLYLNYIFRRTITRKVFKEEGQEQADVKKSTVVDEMQKFWDSCDGKGTSINKFMKKAGTLAKVFGYCGILVDMPNPPKDIENEEERQDLEHRPYVVAYTPIDIVNWEVDDRGKLLWVRVREDLPSKTDAFVLESQRDRRSIVERMEEVERLRKTVATADTVSRTVDVSEQMPMPTRAGVFFSRKGTPVRKYTTWTRDEWITYEIRPRGDKARPGLQVLKTGSGKHACGEVPIVFLYHENDPVDPVVGLSFLQDIAPLNILIMNWLSLLDEEISQKTLNILTMPEQGDEEVTIGANNVLTYTGDQAPQFIAPAATPGELIQTAMEKARDEIYRLSKLTGGVGTLKEVRSGISFSYEFQETEQTLADTADELEHAEESIHRLYMKWMNQEWEGIVDYPEEFGIEDVLADLGVLEKSVGMTSSPTYKAEVQKKVVGRILPKVDEELKQIIYQEIEKIVQMQTEQQLAMQQAQMQGGQEGGEEGKEDSASASAASKAGKGEPEDEKSEEEEVE